MASKSQIEKLGNKIRDNNSIDEQSLIELQNYRLAYKDILYEVFDILSKNTKTIYNEAIITYRIKRIDSIIRKLKRFPKMNLARMIDIAGCRCILKTNNQVYKLKELLSTKLFIRKIKDYIENPQEEGYKSLHLFVSRSKDDDKTIEIQIRCLNDHNWATLVEIVDLIYKTKLKEGEKNENLNRILYLYSNYTNISENEKFDLIKGIANADLFTKLNNIFVNNYIDVRKQWLEIDEKPNYNFFLIETTIDFKPLIKIYNCFNDAEKEYFNIFRKNSNSNLVLVNLQNISYSHISIAYSNYILTMHNFLEDYYLLLQNYIIYSIRNKKIKHLLYSFNQYFNTYKYHIKILKLELKGIKETNNNNMIKKIEWIKEINEQIKKRKKRDRQFKEKLDNIKPKGFFIKMIYNLVLEMPSILSNLKK